MGQLWFNICRQYNLVAAIASFETRAKPHHRRNIRQLLAGCLERDMSPEETQRADEWIDAHYRWIVHPNMRPSLKWVLDMAEVAVIRHGARIVQIDPWNKLEADRPQDMRETDWIGLCLDEIMDFARDMNCHVQIVAHPAKMGDPKNRRGRPELSDIAGSKHWDNKVDLGLSVFRPRVFEDGQRMTECELHVVKSRYEELGYPCYLELDYSVKRGRYETTDYKSKLDRGLAEL
jgi:twinkle protein